MTDSAKALAAQATSLYARAREHKRLSGHHRREARKLMGQFEDIRIRCEQIGIEVIIESTTPAGGTSHGHHRTDP